MILTGLDIGSRYIKIAIIKNGEIKELRKSETGFDSLRRCRELLGTAETGLITATGYGRHLAEKEFGCKTISEISAFARGAHYFNQKIQTVIDVGGQDSKVIRTDSNGIVQSFEMNDKCAAGTGKFLEIMAKTLEMSFDEFGDCDNTPDKQVKISSLCTVFAESEVISLIGSGENRKNIAYALHEMAVERVASLAGRTGLGGEVAFAGGCAYNKLFVKLLAKKLKREVFVSQYPEFTGAIGAALVKN